MADPPRMPIFAEARNGLPSWASVAIKSDIVKPMPPGHAHPYKAVQLTPSGSAACFRRMAVNAAPVMPSDLPSAKPRATPSDSCPTDVAGMCDHFLCY